METSETNSAELEKVYRTTATIVGAQIFSTILLIIIAWFVISFSFNDISDAAYTALWAIILFLALGTFVLRRMLFSWEKLKNTAIVKGVSGLLKNVQTYTILLSSMGEIIAIIGFLIAVLSGNKMEMLRGGAIALIIFLMNFPRKNVWRQIIAAAEKLKVS